MKEVWCMAGIPSSGKTTTAKALSEDGYAHFERDRYIQEIEAEMRKLMAIKTPEGRRNLANTYREIIRQAVEFNSPTFNPNKAQTKTTLDYISPFLEVKDQALLISLDHDGPNWIITFSAAKYRMIIDAFKSKQPAIIDSMEPMHLRGRKEMIEILRQNQISPGIIIIQNTRRKILKNAQTRRENKDRFAHTDDQIKEWFRDNQPLLPKEKWDRVAVIDNSVPQTRESIRAQIANAFHPSTMTEPIPFLI